MPYVALYRKYRPGDFDEIVGQKAIVTTLKNQIKSGKIGHAYLFCGMRGTGKTTTARILAKALNCEKGPTVKPCNECDHCKAINSGSMIDVIEMDAASNRGIDDIRDLREKANFPPSEGRFKIYIIDEVHMLTTEAFNALLKTLEEPPRHVVFILATTEPNKLLPTILSRCMRFDFHRVSIEEIVKHMSEIANDCGVDVEDKALAKLAAVSQGSVRDALSLLDKAFAFGVDKLSYEDVLELLGAVSRDVLYNISEAVVKKDAAHIMQIIDEVASSGKDLSRFIDDLTEHFRNILMICINADRDIIDVIDEEYTILQSIAKNFTKERLLTAIDILNDASNDMKWLSQPRVVLESAMVKLTLPELWNKDEGYISRIQVLEQKVSDLARNIGHISNVSSTKDNIILTAPSVNQIPTSKNLEKPDKDIKTVKPDKNEYTENKDTDSNGADAEQIDDDQQLKKLNELWPEVLNELGKQKKMALLNFIKVGQVTPCDIKL
ncbi:MAG TPA: DNA polymerase III subunit gamma/tau [Thermoanaerobacterales bacterium]|nr:DNA polymerase III subunit gamma/tau [Thermoanaerobacterales bacterium]